MDVSRIIYERKWVGNGLVTSIVVGKLYAPHNNLRTLVSRYVYPVYFDTVVYEFEFVVIGSLTNLEKWHAQSLTVFAL